MSFNICKVRECRFPKDHITKRHCCGICKENGHGQIECGHINLIKDLEQYKNDIITKPCTINECIDSHTHTTKGHSCLYCDKRNTNSNTNNNTNSNTGKNIEHLKFCPLNDKNTSETNYICDNFDNFSKEITSHVSDIKINIDEYKIVPIEMGCTCLVRNNNNIHEYLFMHSDSWGHYGEDTSDLPRYKAFIYGYNKV